MSSEQGKEFAKKYGIEYIETSAKDSLNIEDLFISTTKSFISNQMMNPLKKSNSSFTDGGVMIPNSNKKEEKEGGCC